MVVEQISSTDSAKVSLGLKTLHVGSLQKHNLIDLWFYSNVIYDNEAYLLWLLGLIFTMLTVEYDR